MNVSIQPQKPVIFTGQAFTIAVHIPKQASPIGTISAQILGTAKSLKKTTQITLTNLIKEAFGPDSKQTVFNHTISPIFKIANNIDQDYDFGLTISTTGIPPSYESDSAVINYELVIILQTGQTVNKSNYFPLTFVTQPKQQFILKQIKEQHKFNFSFQEGITVPALECQTCPYGLSMLLPSVQKINITQENEIIAKLSIIPGGYIGGDVSGFIDTKYCNPLELIKLSFWSEEKAKSIEKRIIYQNSIDMRSTVQKRFSVPLPYYLSVPFKSDFIELSYHLEFILSSKKGSWKWETLLQILPQQFTLVPQQLFE